MKPTARRSFTLIELLVVIGILAVLAGIVLPVYVAARERGRQTVCASNLRQLYAASIMYAADNGGRFPPFMNTDPGPDCASTDPGTFDDQDGYCAPDLLHAALMPYVLASDVWFCPSDPFARQASDAWLIDHLYSSYFFGFTRNTVITPDGYRYVTPDGKVLTQAPSELRLVFDPFSAVRASPGYSHLGGINMCYADGHVKLRVLVR